MRFRSFSVVIRFYLDLRGRRFFEEGESIEEGISRFILYWDNRGV